MQFSMRLAVRQEILSTNCTKFTTNYKFLRTIYLLC